MKDSLVTLAILVLCIELYRLFRGYWIQRILKKKSEAKQLRKPRVMKPKSERDCPFCMEEKADGVHPNQERLWHGGFAKVVAVQRRKYRPQVSFVQTGIANITA